MVALYQRLLGGYPVEAIDWLCTKALRECKWMPRPSECAQMLQGWRRKDATARAIAENRLQRHLVEQRNQLIRRLNFGEVTQQEADSLNPQTRAYLIEHGYLQADGKVRPVQIPTTKENAK